MLTNCFRCKEFKECGLYEYWGVNEFYCDECIDEMYKQVSEDKSQ